MVSTFALKELYDQDFGIHDLDTVGKRAFAGPMLQAVQPLPDQQELTRALCAHYQELVDFLESDCVAISNRTSTWPSRY